MYLRLAELWADSSLQMHRLCSANGIAYFHFLQPTRHYPEIDPTDLSRGVDDPLRDRVQAGFPALRQQCDLLQERGVACFDLTDSFVPVHEGNYIDFCHLNKTANDQLAAEIGRSISEYKRTH
jgi:hypothetical protein